MCPSARALSIKENMKIKRIKNLFRFPFPSFSNEVRRNGQALIEIIVLLPMLVIIISVIVWFSRLLLTRQQLLTAARYGTDMIMHTPMEAADIRQEIKNYLTHKGPDVQGRVLNPSKLTDDKIKIEINRFSKIGPEDAITAMMLVNLMNYKTSYVEIYYPFKLPTMFKAFSSYIPNAGELPGEIYISARSEVIAGTGCKSDIHD